MWVKGYESCVVIGWFCAGDFSWGLVPEVPGVSPVEAGPPAAAPPPAEEEGGADMEEEVAAAVAQLMDGLSALRSVLSPVFCRGLFAFFAWWVAACQVISSLFGVYFHQYLIGN